MESGAPAKLKPSRRRSLAASSGRTKTMMASPSLRDYLPSARRMAARSAGHESDVEKNQRCQPLIVVAGDWLETTADRTGPMLARYALVTSRARQLTS